MTDRRLIAVEEHFLVDELLVAGQTYLGSPAAAASGWREAGAALEDEDRDRRGALTLDLGAGGIPFSLSRLDAHHAQTRVKTTPHLQGRPSEYVRDHVTVSTSGMNHAPASIRFCSEQLGADRVMFAADYPFEDLDGEVAAFARVPLSDPERAALAHDNAARVFGLA